MFLVVDMKFFVFQAAGNMNEETLLGKVAELDEETTSKLKEVLDIK